MTTLWIKKYKALNKLQGIKKYYVLKLLLSVMDKIFLIIYPLLFAKMIDSIFIDRDIKLFIKIIFIYTLFFLLQQLVIIMIGLLNIKLEDLFLNQSKNDLFKKIITTKPKHLLEISSTEQVNILSNDITMIKSYFDDVLSYVVLWVYIIILFVVISIYSWQLSLIVFFLAFFTVYISDKSKQKFQQIKKEYRQQYGECYSWVVESLNGMQDIRINCCEESYIQKFENFTIGLLKNKEKSRFIELQADRLNGFYNAIFTLCFWTISAIFIIKNIITLGTFYAIDKYFNNIVSSISKLKQLKINCYGYQVNFDKIAELDCLDNEDYNFENINLEKIQNDEAVCFEDVTFGYNENLVIKDVNFTIEKGKVVGIVGSNGAGKSTIFDLLEKFYTVNSGVIKIDGIDISNLSLDYIRSKIGYIQQNTIVFDGTIEDNLRLFKPDATHEEMINVLKLSGLYDELTKWQDGINTVISKGENLSGGQKQRLAIACQLLKNPDIVILDEPTSSLDYNTGLLIMSNIKDVFQDKTLIIVTHKINEINTADYIVVLKNGEIIDIGHDTQLQKRCDEYKQLFYKKSKSRS